MTQEDCVAHLWPMWPNREVSRALTLHIKVQPDSLAPEFCLPKATRSQSVLTQLSSVTKASNAAFQTSCHLNTAGPCPQFPKPSLLQTMPFLCLAVSSSCPHDPEVQVHEGALWDLRRKNPKQAYNIPARAWVHGVEV